VNRSATGRRWQRRGIDSGFRHPRLPETISRLLASRGIESEQSAEAFLSAKVAVEHDPMLLPQVDLALERVARAVRQDELVAVFGDFDVDGVTATAILVEGITALGGRAIRYLPHRFSEGYGLNKGALAGLRDRGVSLVISADCGISSVDEVAYANEIGLDVIVVDHHSIPEQLPDAVALVNPKLEDCAYPCTELAACGVAFKLLLALADHLCRPYEPAEHLDLVALGTVCDMAPLVGENRSIVRRGLKALQRTDRPGLWALAKSGGFDLRRADAETLGFRIGPRLNAAGRLEHAGLAYELITTRDEVRAKALAEHLERLNAERQRQTREAVALARELAAEEPADAPLIMVGHPSISSGIVGLVAGRLAEEHYRPAVVYERGAEQSRGSARSIPEFNMVEALHRTRPLMLACGGHRAAGGFTARNENLPAVREQLSAWAAERLAGVELAPVVEYDDELSLDQLGAQERKWLPYLEPFGQGNPEPIFVARGLRVAETRKVGGDGSHLQLRLRSERAVWRGIAFGLAHAAPSLGERLDVAFALRTDRDGRIDLHVRDFVPS
jgi:single-stranded-DNA-specific exonuclease